MHTDRHVIVIGGGVAGLTAASELRECKVTLIEAKDRFGGRVHCIQASGHAIDLGAEFVHGQSKALLHAIEEAGCKIIPTSDRNQMFENGSLTRVDIWGEFGELTKHIDSQERDRSFVSFLHLQNLDERMHRMMLAFVSGFNAADPKQISTHSLLRAEYAAEQMGGDQQSFTAEGYGPLIDHLVEKATRAGARLLTNNEAKKILWSRGKVEVELKSGETLRGDAAIVTVPLGVLKAGYIRFKPALTNKEEAINDMGFGNVVKVKLVFRKCWWPEDPNFGFIHILDEPLKTWWSDPRGPVLTGWTGGPSADLLLKQSHAELEKIAVRTLTRLFSVSPETVRRELVASYYYNWAEDRQVRGAYSYIPVDGLFLPKLLGAPVEDTLFFAGEATARDAQMGTVFAALESGHRVAREVEEALLTV